MACRNTCLPVHWSASKGAKAGNKTPSDEALKQAVRATLDQDSRLVDDQITLRVSFGNVTLDGSVLSVYEKRIAEQDAKNLMGVAWVQSNLFARAEQRSDWAIEDDVQFNLDTDYKLTDN